MRQRNKTLNVKVKALESLKKISQECYDLTSPALTTTPIKPLLCQVELFSRTTPQIQLSASNKYNYSAPVSRTARSIAHEPRYVSAFDVGSSIASQASPIQTEHFCKKLYTSKLIETQSKENGKQKNLFMRKLGKAINGNILNASGYELGVLSIKQICNFLIKSDITDLILDRNNFKDQGVIELAKIVPKLRLKRISLVSVGMTEKSCKIFIAQLSKIETLEQLNFSSNQGFNRNKLHKDAFEGISKLTGNGKANLKLLKCGGVGLDDNNFTFLALGLGRNSNLQHLSIQDNQVTSLGMQKFKQHAVHLHLRYLDCSNNKIDGGGLLQIGSLIGSDYNLTKISKALKCLRINRNKIKSKNLSVFSKQMINNQTLEQVFLDGNPLGEGGKLNIFTNFIGRNWAIKLLSLSQSLKSTDDVLMLCDAIQFNRGLENLNISRNNLQFCAFKKLVEALSRNKSIKIVHAQACGIVDSFVTRIEDSMLQLKNLHQLYLDHNFLNDNAGRVIQKTIFHNKAIIKVQLHGNSLSIKMQHQIDRALSYNIDSKRFDGPDLTYYEHIEELQGQQKIALQQTIQQLKMRENQLNCRQLLHSIAKRDLQSVEKAGVILRQTGEIQKITDIKNNLQRLRQLQQQQLLQSKQQNIIQSRIKLKEQVSIERGISISMISSHSQSDMHLSQTQ